MPPRKDLGKQKRSPQTTLLERSWLPDYTNQRHAVGQFLKKRPGATLHHPWVCAGTSPAPGMFCWQNEISADDGIRISFLCRSQNSGLPVKMQIPTIFRYTRFLGCLPGADFRECQPFFCHLRSSFRSSVPSAMDGSPFFDTGSGCD